MTHRFSFWTNKEEVLTDANLSELFSLSVKVLEKEGYYQAWS
jgi:iron complex transport system ATP-binding protein